MKITDVRCTPVGVPRRKIFDRTVVTGLGPAAVSRYTLVELMTDTDHVGLGEAACVFDPTGAALATYIESQMRPKLLGRNPFDRSALNAMLRSSAPTGYEPALAAIDIALHDLMGKALDVPVYDLLGGMARPRVPLSYSIPFGEPGEVVRFSRECLERGFKTLKIKIGQSHDRDVECVHRVCEAVPNDVIVRVDANMSFGDATAALKFIDAIAGLHIELLEQPLAPDCLAETTRIRERSPIPIMVDENVWGPATVVNVISAQAADVLNVYVMESGGLEAARVNFSMAEAAGLKCMIGSMPELGIGTAAQIHLGVAVPNLDLAADCCGSLYHDDDVTQPSLCLEDGFAVPPSGPGLGVELDWEKVDNFRLAASGSAR